MKTRGVIAVIGTVAAFASTAAAEPLDTLRKALAAEEAAPFERMRLFMERGGRSDVYYVDRIRPGRIRVVKNPRQGGMELIVIDGTQWVRAGSEWHRAPVQASASAPPSLAQILEQGLTGAVERAEPDGSRSIEGEMSWFHAVRCTGPLKLRIGRDGRPSLVRFEGTCGGKPARFRQAFSFAGPVTIEPPE